MTLTELQNIASINKADNIANTQLINAGSKEAYFLFIEPPKNYILVHDPILIDTGYLCILRDLDYVEPIL